MNVQRTTSRVTTNYTLQQIEGLERILNDWVNDPANGNNRENCLLAADHIRNFNELNRGTPPINQRSLNLSNLNLTILPDLSLVLPSDLYELNLSGNNLTNISRTTFSGLPNLRVLDLCGVDLSNFPEDVFFDLQGNCTIHISTESVMNIQRVHNWMSNRVRANLTFRISYSYSTPNYRAHGGNPSWVPELNLGDGQQRSYLPPPTARQHHAQRISSSRTEPQARPFFVEVRQARPLQRFLTEITNENVVNMINEKLVEVFIREIPVKIENTKIDLENGLCPILFEEISTNTKSEFCLVLTGAGDGVSYKLFTRQSLLNIAVGHNPLNPLTRSALKDSDIIRGDVLLSILTEQVEKFDSSYHTTIKPHGASD